MSAQTTLNRKFEKITAEGGLPAHNLYQQQTMTPMLMNSSDPGLIPVENMTHSATFEKYK